MLAEVLMQNDVEIDVESETITWLMGVTSNPPQNKAPKAKLRAHGPLPAPLKEGIVYLAH